MAQEGDGADPAHTPTPSLERCASRLLSRALCECQLGLPLPQTFLVMVCGYLRVEATSSHSCFNQAQKRLWGSPAYPSTVGGHSTHCWVMAVKPFKS